MLLVTPYKSESVLLVREQLEGSSQQRALKEYLKKVKKRLTPSRDTTQKNNLV